jgi:hypothetical protein
MVTCKYRFEISRVVSGSPKVVRNFHTALAAFLTENAKTRVNPTLSALDQQAKDLSPARPGALGEFFGGSQRGRHNVPIGDIA